MALVALLRRRPDGHSWLGTSRGHTPPTYGLSTGIGSAGGAFTSLSFPQSCLSILIPIEVIWISPVVG